MKRSLRRLHSVNHKLHSDKTAEILQPFDPSNSVFIGVKSVFTIGPACQDVDTICKILNAGASCARVDITWGEIGYHMKSLQNLQLAMRRTKRMCAVMIDTIGREITVVRPINKREDGWWTHNESYEVQIGQEITITADDIEATPTRWPINYKKLSEMANPGDTIYVSRYLETGGAESCTMLVKEVEGTDVICEAQTAASLSGLLTLWHIERDPYGPISNIQNELPILSDKDKDTLKELRNKYEIDFISLSHTREAEDIEEARAFLAEIKSATTKIIAKIETKYALTRFKNILSKADAMMVSRANLGLDVPAEKIALIQKNMVSWCNLIGKPCIITRVCDSMTNAPRPTRAEATDVANIVLDGADGFVLGAETLRGKYPVETVTTVMNIGRVAEQQFDGNSHFDYLMEEAILNQESASRDDFSSKGSMSSAPSTVDLSNAVNTMAIMASREEHDETASISSGPTVKGIPYLSKVESIASSAVRAAAKISAKLLVVFTHSGHTAQLVAKYRPQIPILTLVVPKITTNSLSWKLEGREVARQILLVRGCLPMLTAPKAGTDETLKEAILAAQARGLIGSGDRVVVVQRVHVDFALQVIALDDLLADSPIETPKGKREMLKTLSEVTEMSAGGIQ